MTELQHSAHCVAYYDNKSTRAFERLENLFLQGLPSDSSAVQTAASDHAGSYFRAVDYWNTCEMPDGCEAQEANPC